MLLHSNKITQLHTKIHSDKTEYEKVTMPLHNTLMMYGYVEI